MRCKTIGYFRAAASGFAGLSAGIIPSRRTYIYGESEIGKTIGRGVYRMGKKEDRQGGYTWRGTIVRIGTILLLALCCICIAGELSGERDLPAWQKAGRLLSGEQAVEVTADGNYIKWVEFHVTDEAMEAAYNLDVDTYRDEIHLNWIELLAYAAARTGGTFDNNSARQIEDVSKKLKSGESTMEELTKDMKYYDYYLEAYTAVLGGMTGEFTLGGKRYYGLKAFSPIAKGFDYSHYDDFGTSRSYGYSRPHLGHDMMGQIGTPIGIKYRACASKNDAQALIF